ncbi:hypothetical protein AB0B44_38790, partial [Streptomyces sp. NPDC041003]
MSARIIGRRLRKGAAAALLSALVAAALTASQGPAGAGEDRTVAIGEGEQALPAEASGGDTAYFTELPPLASPEPPAVVLPDEAQTPQPQAPETVAVPAGAATGPADSSPAAPLQPR